ncbi:type VI secretion system-associated protein TagF [Roseospira navarrensis]|uniref:Type VI secretion system-associated protein TagF n=1 Tax=Roseospira navarrensis TaxID=140058 RepID=A0A7X2D487_9PROT|nr:type VI secretion system-associated protein TagF [Roseospira navarrensis]MQX35935.1 type VI secretion system-associated protein TagF [Roseospira navarrensis]
MGTIGFHGKLPAHGDFVRRGLDHQVAEAWDTWLGRLMSALRDDLGEETWLETYLTGPVWRFALGAGISGRAQTGVVVPSVDRVGRYFPLMLAAPVDDLPSLAAVLRDGRPLLDALEDLALAVLEADQPLTAEDLEEALHDLEWAWPPVATRPSPGPGQPGTWVPLGGEGVGAAAAAIADLLDRGVPLPVDGDGGLWWTEGSEHVGPGLVRVTGWPRPSAAVSFFDGAWAARGWTDEDVAPPFAGRTNGAGLEHHDGG